MRIALVALVACGGGAKEHPSPPAAELQPAAAEAQAAPVGGDVQVGTPEVDGGISYEAVMAPMKEHIAEFRACYTAAVATHPGLFGTVKASFSINVDGETSNVTATGPEELVPCVVKTIQGITFGRGANILVHYPFTFGAPPPT